MKKSTKILIIVSTLLVTLGFLLWDIYATRFGAPPYDESQETTTDSFNDADIYSNWKRPNGPIRIGLQAGHWKTKEMPEEQARIRDAGGGTSSQGKPEWEVVLKIAEETAKILQNEGYVVDILPATVPEKYWADAFVSIHADGNLNPMVSGYKVAAYQRDRTGKAHYLSSAIEKSYGDVVKFGLDPNITRNMTRYYAFNSRRYKHSIHPMTPGVLVETGFLTNPTEAKVLIYSPETAANGIAQGIINYINSHVLNN